MSALNAYANLMYLPDAPNNKPGAPFDYYDAAPIVATPQGNVQQQQPGGRVRGLVPGTVYGGLVDTRYTQGMEHLIPAPRRPVEVQGPTAGGGPLMGYHSAPQRAVSALDVDLATGVNQYDRESQYQRLLDDRDALEAQQRYADAEGRNPEKARWRNVRTDVIQQGQGELEQHLARFLVNQQPIGPEAYRSTQQTVAKSGNVYRDRYNKAREGAIGKEREAKAQKAQARRR